jgi:hypothetical protein
VSDLDLLGDLSDGGHGVVFDGADADLCVEDDDEEAIFVDVTDEQAVIFALLIDAGEVGFADEAGDALGGGVGGCGEGAEGGGIEGASIAGFADDEAAFIEDEGGGGFAFLEEFLEGAAESADIVFHQLGEGSHGLGGGAAFGFVDKFVKEHASDHIEGFEDALALAGDAAERGDLDFAIIEEELHIIDWSDVWEVAFIVLEDVRDIGEVEFEGAQIFFEVGEAFDVIGHFIVLGIGDEDDAVDAAEDELASGVIDDLAWDGIELEFGAEALDGDGFDGEEIEEESAIGAGGEGDEFTFFLGSADILVNFDQVRGFTAHGGAVIDDFDLKFLRGLVDDGHCGFTCFEVRGERL